MVRRGHGTESASSEAASQRLGQLLRRCRRERGLTQEQLAERSGISVRAIGNLERGVKHRPRDATLELLAEALHLSAPQRAMLLASVSQPDRTIGGEGTVVARLPVVAVQPTYPLPVSGPLVAREDVLECVLEMLPDVATRLHGVRTYDGPELMLVASEAGMGKTRLLAEIARRAGERGLLVLAGGSYKAEGRLPLGAFHDALLDYLEGQSDEVLRVQIGGLLGDLGRVVPELRERFPDVTNGQTASLEDQRPRIFWTIARVFERIGEVLPLVLLLDDLQWADETTLQMLHYLTRQPDLGRMLIVGAYRPGETAASRELNHLVTESIRRAGAHYLDLRPLDVSGLATVLAHRLGGACAPDLVHAVHERSAGNPFFALEIVELLQQEGRLEQHHDEHGAIWTLEGDMGCDLPRAVRETIAQRLNQVAPDVLEVLQLTAVVGLRVAYPTLTDLWEAEERSLLRALDTAIAAQILEETERGYAFRHPLLQEVVYRQLSAAHRAWLHGRIAESLEAMYGTRVQEHASELAHHVVAGGKDGERALHYLTLAAEASVRASAWQEALTSYHAARQYASTDRSIGEIEEHVGGVLKALGRYDDALVALDEAVTRYERVGDLQRVGEVTAALVEVHALRGSWEQGRARGSQVIDRLEQLSPATGEYAQVLANLYFALTYLHDTGPEKRLQAAERAAELARIVEDVGLHVRAEMRRSFMLYAMRRFEEAQGVIEGLIPLAERVRDTDTLRFAVDILADIHKLEGRFHRSLHGRERALAYAEERPDEPHWIMVGLAQLGEARFLLGDWAGARALYERAVQMSRIYPAPHYTAFALLGLGALDLAEGRWEEATQLIEACIADAQGTNDVHWVRNAERLLAHRDLLLGGPDAALRRLEREGDDHTGTLYLRAWGYLDAADIQRAAATIERCITLAKERNTGLDLCEAWIVRGRIHHRQNCFNVAEDSFREALALARSMPYPFAEGRALFEWGQTLVAYEKRETARGPLEQALQIFQRLGARRFVQQAERSLRDRASAQVRPE